MSAINELKHPTLKLELPSNKKIKVYVKHGPQVVKRKHRDAEGHLSFVDLTLQGTSIDVVMEDDNSMISGRACCKPPDSFSKQFGMKTAVNHLFKEDKNKKLSREDREFLIRMLCPRLFKV